MTMKLKINTYHLKLVSDSRNQLHLGKTLKELRSFQSPALTHRHFTTPAPLISMRYILTSLTISFTFLRLFSFNLNEITGLANLWLTMARNFYFVMEIWGNFVELVLYQQYQWRAIGKLKILFSTKLIQHSVILVLDFKLVQQKFQLWQFMQAILCNEAEYKFDATYQWVIIWLLLF